MLKCLEENSVVLGVGVNSPVNADPFSNTRFTSAANGVEALDILQVLNADFLFVNIDMPDMSVWEFVHAMRSRFPQLKWALVAGELNDTQEIAARSMGVTAIFESMPSMSEIERIASPKRRRRAASITALRFSEFAID